jgi:mRNA interferase MazF
MIAYKKGEIILVPFPFTDLSATKRRPALILSPEKYNQSGDVIIAFITSNLNTSSQYGDYILKEWQKSGLPKPSLLRMKLATIEKNIIVKKLGKLDSKDLAEFEKVVVEFFSV